MRTWLALALLLLGLAAQAQDLVPVPPLARVTDLSATLTPAQKAALEAKLAAFETAHGAQVAVLMLPSTQPEPIEDYAHRVGEAWKIGRAGVGDGLLMVVAKDDRRVRIDVARTLEGAIPDLAAKRVIREDIGPRFKDGDYAGGINAGLDRLFGLVEGEGLPAPVGVPASKVSAGEDMVALLLPFIIGGVIVAGILRRLLGAPGAVIGGVGAGLIGGWMLASIGLGLLIAVAAAVIGFGSRGGIFIPGGGGRGGGWSGGGGGGWTSGGGGDFSGGGASGGW